MPTGFYSGFHPDLPAGLFRGKVRDGRRRPLRTQHDPAGPVHDPARRTDRGDGRGLATGSPWRPAHIHLIVEAPGHEPLITQSFFEGSEYLDGDVAGAVKEDLVVRPEAGHVAYDFALAPAVVPRPA